jgi:asparagine synthase (glutamine-hydrolysing)
VSGIAGILDGASQPLPESALASMAAAMLHRGPDAEGLYKQRGLGLAWRRLGTPPDAAQPVCNENQTIVAIFDGAIYNAPSLRAELQGKGYRLKGDDDAQLLPHLWEEHQEQFLLRLEGQFALALWDQSQQRLLIARDRFGICPVHWIQQADRLIFGSEIKTLLGSGLVRPEVDPRGIAQVFTCFGLPGPHTCFAGVSSLLPGCYLDARRSVAGRDSTLQVRQVRYWDMDFPDARSDWADRLADEKEVLDRFEAVLLQAVERRLKARLAIVPYSSGGLDSSLLVAMARKIQGEPLTTLTFRVEHPGRDETTEADLLASQLGNRSLVVPIQAEKLLGTYPRLVQAAESPVIDTSAAALFLLAEQAHAHGYKAVLTGEGSDEWLAGYPWFRIDKKVDRVNLIPGLRLSRLGFRLYQRLLGMRPLSWSHERRMYEAVGGHNAWMYPYFLMSATKMRLFSNSLLESLGDYHGLEGLELNLSRMKQWHPLDRSLYIGARIHLAGLHLKARGDRSTMHSSVQPRYPFLDEAVYAFLARLEPAWKMRGFEDKFILRRLAQRWLPPELSAGRKRLIHAPLYAFHHARQPAWMDQLLSPESLRKSGYFKPEAVAYWRSALPQMRHNYARLFTEMGLAGVVSTQLWHNTYIDASLADLPGWTWPKL